MYLGYRILAELAERSPRSTRALARALDLDADRLRERTAEAARWGVSYDSEGDRWRAGRTVEILHEARIRASMGAASAHLAGLEILVEVDSTNAHLGRRRRDGLGSGHACLAEGQTAGRGRRGNRWVSPFGANVYLSVLWEFPAGTESLAGLSLAAGLAAVRALEELGVSGVGLKWPNDLVWRDRKLGGVLVEVSGGRGAPWTAVAGIGLNLAMPEPDGAEIDQDWVGLDAVAGPGIGRNRVAGAVLGRLLAALAAFARHGFGPDRQAWTDRHAWQGREVAVHTEAGVRVGVAAGIDENGALLLSAGGRVERHLAGDVSLRRSVPCSS